MFAESPCFKVFVILDSLFRIVAKSVWPVITCRYGIIVARVTASINALPSQAGNSLTRFRIGVKCGSSLLWYYARCANWLSFHLLRLPHTVYRMTASPPNWRVPFSGTLMSADLGRVYERSAAPRSNQPRNRGNVSPLDVPRIRSGRKNLPHQHSSGWSPTESHFVRAMQSRSLRAGYRPHSRRAVPSFWRME